MKRFVFFLVCAFLINPVHADTICTGATYYDANTDGCVACPAGYDYNTDDGKTDITQCQIYRDAGTYLVPGYSKLEYLQTNGAQYIDTGIQSTGIGLKSDVLLELTQKKSQEQAAIGRSSSGGYEVYFSSDGNTIGTWRNSAENAKLSINYAANTLYRIQSEMTNDSITQDVNGTQVSTLKTLATGTLADIYLFRHTSNYYLYAKVYYVKIWNNGTLVRDFIPVRRDFDGELGLYDIVTKQFFTNAGTGTFTAGPYSGRVYLDVGVGYWAAAEAINYGSIGTRNACSAGTYSDNPNATSVDDCTLCVGATYNDEIGQSACKMCPGGYDYNTDDGKTDITQCQTHCDGGAYCDGYTELEYLTIDGTYIDTGLKMGTDITVGRGRLYVDASLLNITENSGEKVITGGSNFWVGKDNGWCVGYGANTNDVCTSAAPSSNRCVYDLDLVNKKYTVYDTENDSYLLNISITPGAAASDQKISIGGYNGTTSASNVKVYRVSIYSSDVLVFDGIPARHNSSDELGLYDLVSRTFKTKGDTRGTLTAGPDTLSNFCGGCVDVGVGNYAEASTVNYGSVGTRNTCPAELTTVGYGAGADAANDCGRILHIGDNIIYLHSEKITTPSLNIDMDGDGTPDFFGNMTTNDVYMHDGADKKFKVQYNGQTYSVYDDTIIP